MVFSPVLLLGFISANARLGSSAVPLYPQGQEGYGDRLAQYEGLIRTVSRVRDAVWLDPNSPEAIKVVSETIREVERPLPLLESTRLDLSADEDCRMPVARAVQTAAGLLRSEFASALRERDSRRVVRAGIALLRTSEILKYADRQSHIRESAATTQAVRMLRSALPLLKPHELSVLSSALLAIESTRPHLTSMFERDLHLFLRLGYSFKMNQKFIDAARVGRSALNDVQAGKPLAKSLDRISQWDGGPERERLWLMLAAWELCIRDEVETLRAVRELAIEARFREVKALGADPRDMPGLGMPPEMLADPATGLEAVMRLSQRGVALEWGQANADCLAPVRTLLARR